MAMFLEVTRSFVQNVGKQFETFSKNVLPVVKHKKITTFGPYKDTTVCIIGAELIDVNAGKNL